MRFIHSLKKAGLCIWMLMFDGFSRMGVMHKMKRKPDVAKWVIGSHKRHISHSRWEPNLVNWIFRCRFTNHNKNEPTNLWTKNRTTCGFEWYIHLVIHLVFRVQCPMLSHLINWRITAKIRQILVNLFHSRLNERDNICFSRKHLPLSWRNFPAYNHTNGNANECHSNHWEKVYGFVPAIELFMNFGMGAHYYRESLNKMVLAIN